MNQPELANRLREKLRSASTIPIVTGFDGFIDEMISVVDERQSLSDYQRIETIQHFSEKISQAAGHSSLREVVVTQTDPGGCAVNMGDGLASLGLPVSTFATVGKPIHSAFADYAKKAKLISWGDEPGRTMAYEFADGKLMFSAVSQLQSFHPDALSHYISDGRFQEICEAATLIAITDWALYPHMTACWDFLREEVFSKLSVRPRFFFDLVDPSSRSETDVREMLSALSRYAKVGEVTLGLNQNEANILVRVTGGSMVKVTEPGESSIQAAHLRDALGIDSVIIHSLQYAVGIDGKESAQVWGPFCEKPRKSTGAGDRFNSGYALGKVFDLGMTDRLTVACASSGFFVRTGHSANPPELVEFLSSGKF